MENRCIGGCGRLVRIVREPAERAKVQSHCDSKATFGYINRITRRHHAGAPPALCRPHLRDVGAKEFNVQAVTVDQAAV